MLDVGCGTGTLALVAKERVGATGRVSGIDPSAQLLTRARRKAARPGADKRVAPRVVAKAAPTTACHRPTSVAGVVAGPNR